MDGVVVPVVVDVSVVVVGVETVGVADDETVQDKPWFQYCENWSYG